MRNHHSLYTILLLILFIGLNKVSYGQEKLTYPLVKANIEKFYLEGNWSALISTGKEAQKQEFDFYQLHYCMGVAYFEEGLFFQSIHHFEKAKKQNYLVSSDTIFMTYLYYAYANTLQNGLAEQIRRESGLNNLKQIIHPITTLGFNVGIMIPTIQADTLMIKQTNYNPPNPPITTPFYREMNYPEKQNYQSLSLESDLGPMVHIWFNYTRINAYRYTSLSGPINMILEPYEIKQNQIYAGAQYQLNYKWSAYLGANYFTYKSNKLEFDGFDNFNLLQTNRNSSNHQNYLVTMTLNRHHKNFKFGLSATLAEINETIVYQEDFCFVYFPFSNIDYYTVSNLSYKYSAIQSGFIFHQQFGFKVSEQSWVELEGRIGDLKNYSDLGGSNVYNLNDDLNMMGGITVKQKIFKQLLFTTTFAVCSKTNTYGDIVNPNDEIISKENKYKQFNIIGGIKWIF